VAGCGAGHFWDGGWAGLRGTGGVVQGTVAACQIERLRKGTIDVWRVDLAAVGARAMQLLSPAERRRAAAMVDPGRRALWMRSRGVLRLLLGAYLERPAQRLEFVAGAHGKPALIAAAAGNEALGSSAGTPAPGAAAATLARSVSFNLSHSAATALYAFTLAADVGIDLELARTRKIDEAAMALRAFGPEQSERLRSLPARARGQEFLRLWVAHEAALKCRGDGLTSARESPEPSVTAGLWIAELDLGSGAAAAVAVQAGPQELRFWGYPA
jgi:phosphopantetheinyl transferase